MKKSICGLALTLSLLFCLAAPAFATEPNDIFENKLDEISEQYGLKDVVQLPDGVTPLEFDTLEEMDAYLSSISEVNISVTTNLTTGESVIQGVNTDTVHNTVEGNKTARSNFRHGSYATEQKVFLDTLAYLHLVTDYTYDNPYSGTGPINPKNDYLVSANASCYMTGITWGVSLSPSSTTSTISPDKRSFYSISRGVIAFYLDFSGINKYMEQAYSINHTGRLVG